jgi:hypothetical protein
MATRRRSHATRAAFWKTVVDVAVDRPGSLAELESTFRSGSVPGGVDGLHAGRLVASTVGYGVDLVLETLARAWMPWKGKTFDAAEDTGWNVFDPRGRWVARLLWPSYRVRVGAVDEGAARRLDEAFRFVTSTGPSALLPGVEVLRIDYDLQENPPWPVRRVLDEVVEVDPGLLLGQALFDLRGRWRRAAWFSLEATT